LQRPHRPRRKLGLELALELGPCTAVTLHPFASMGITGMHRTPALLTATTDQAGSREACLSELDPGSTGLVEDTGAAEVTMAAAALAGADLKAAVRDSLDEAGMRAVRLLDAGPLVVPPVAVVSTAVVVSAAAVVSTAAEVTVAVDTGN
jgi:hypothetical protein